MKEKKVNTIIMLLPLIFSMLFSMVIDIIWKVDVFAIYWLIGCIGTTLSWDYFEKKMYKS